jgi:signal transduction histidine kinase
MIQNIYNRLRYYFIPDEKKSNPDSQLLLVIDFYILTAIFTLFYVLIYAMIELKEGVISVGFSTLLFFIGLILIKKGLNIALINHFYLFVGGFFGVFITIYFSGGLQSPVMPWLVVLPVTALLLFDTMKDVIIWIVIPVVVILSFMIASFLGFSTPISYNLGWKNFYLGISYSGLTLIIFIVSYIFKSFINNNLNQLKAAQDQLIQSEKLASLGELTAGIAHEIQNPLNFVNNFSELSMDLVNDLKEEMGKPDIDKEYIDELFTDLSQNQEKINHHGKRASSIVKGMLEHSRESTGVREWIDINQLADEYLRLSYHGLRAKDKSFNSDFKTDFQDTLPKIEVIPQDLGRVFLNLINNAFYAVNERKKNVGEVSNLADVRAYQPTVTVSTQQIDSQIIIKVKDNGTGMSETVKTKVFQPFFTTKPTGSGTGLGLSLSYEMVTKGHGGSLEVVSTEGVGTEFIIKLPVTYLQSK